MYKKNLSHRVKIDCGSGFGYQSLWGIKRKYWGEVTVLLLTTFSQDNKYLQMQLQMMLKVYVKQIQLICMLNYSNSIFYQSNLD